MEIYLRLILQVFWFVGAVLVWHYGRRVPRLRFPMSWCAVGFFLLSLRGCVATFDSEPNSPWDPPLWLVDLSIFIAFPAVAAVVSGLVYACANADRIQRTVPKPHLD